MPCDVLLNPRARDLPDHVCEEAAHESVRRNGYLVEPLFALLAPGRREWPLGAHGLQLATDFDTPTWQPIGLIVERRLAQGKVTLFGHALPSRFEREPGAQAFLGTSSPTAQPPPLLPLWTFTEPTLQATWYPGTPPAEAREVEALRRAIARWYGQHVLGRSASNPRGRPPGSGADGVDFPARLGEAVSGLASAGLPVTEANAAGLLGIGERTLRGYLADRRVTWKDVRSRRWPSDGAAFAHTSSRQAQS